jgi:hypothetical protein
MEFDARQRRGEHDGDHDGEHDGEDDRDDDGETEGNAAVSMEEVFDQPALFVNAFNTLAFQDETVRLTLWEAAAPGFNAPRGAFRLTLGKAQELSQALAAMVQITLTQRAQAADARAKMN